jgi:hypothetical protein
MTRFRAAGIHFVLSALVITAILALMFFVWYPKGLFKLLGGSGLVYIIAGVDVCLGPLLTLAVFNTAKKSLKFDLAVIGILQIAALMYGANVMFKSRPVFNVLEEDVFKVTLASNFKDNKELLKAKNPDWRTLPWAGPVLVAALAPTDPKEKSDLVIAAGSGLDWNMFPKLFVSYDSQRDVALKNAKPLAELRKVSADNGSIIDAFLKRQQQAEQDFVYLPITYQFTAMTAVLDAKNADFIAVIDTKTSD